MASSTPVIQVNFSPPILTKLSVYAIMVNADVKTHFIVTSSIIFTIGGKVMRKYGKKFFASLLVVVLCTTCFETMGVSAKEIKAPKVDQVLVDKVAEEAWGIIPKESTVVTPSAIGVGVEVTPPAIEIVPPLPCPPDEVLPVPPQPTYEPTYEVEIPEHVEVEVTGITVDEGAEDEAPPVLSYEEQQEMFMDMERGRVLAWLVQNGLDYGIIDSASRLEKRLTYGELCLMVYNSISPYGQILNTGDNRAIAAEWVKKEFGVSYKLSKKMTFSKASKIFSKVLGEKGDLWKEGFQNLKKEAEWLLPTLSLGGDKMSKGQGLYMILMLLEPDISYGPMITQNNQNG